MDRVLFMRTLQAQRSKVLIVAIAVGIWGVLMPLIYTELIDTPLGAQFKQMIDSGLFPAQFTNFGGGNLFTLPGSIALGFIHPIFVAIICVFAIGFTAAAVAGERQRGTLEVVLAPDLATRGLWLAAGCHDRPPRPGHPGHGRGHAGLVGGLWQAR
jgi:ABC-type transport system involved in multi-copper enzyme maturation permease subunit